MIRIPLVPKMMSFQGLDCPRQLPTAGWRGPPVNPAGLAPPPPPLKWNEYHHFYNHNYRIMSPFHSDQTNRCSDKRTEQPSGAASALGIALIVDGESPALSCTLPLALHGPCDPGQMPPTSNRHLPPPSSSPPLPPPLPPQEQGCR